jgi:hypothetical protein
MISRTLARLVVAAALPVIAVFGSALPAAATETFPVPLHEPHRNKTAADLKPYNCDHIPGDKPVAGMDGFVFVLPGDGKARSTR